MIVNWTDPALDDLNGIFDFISRDAPVYAQIFVEQILDAVDRLEVFPRSGRMVPEAKNDEVREVIFQNYRIVYWIFEAERLDIIAVMHGSRDMSSPVNQPWEVQ